MGSGQCSLLKDLMVQTEHHQDPHEEKEQTAVDEEGSQEVEVKEEVDGVPGVGIDAGGHKEKGLSGPGAEIRRRM
jgi:hypothetical protein